MYPDDSATETFRDKTIANCQPFKGSIQRLTRGILLQKYVCQVSVYINKVILLSGKAPEFVDVTCFADFIRIVCINQFFKLIQQRAKPVSGNMKQPRYRSLQSVICQSYSEPVKRMDHNLQAIKIVMHGIGVLYCRD